MEIYIGDPVEHESERSTLREIELSLAADGCRAMVFAHLASGGCSSSDVNIWNLRNANSRRDDRLQSRRPEAVSPPLREVWASPLASGHRNYAQMSLLLRGAENDNARAI